jgi:hypothetical protein
MHRIARTPTASNTSMLITRSIGRPQDGFETTRARLLIRGLSRRGPASAVASRVVDLGQFVRDFALAMETVDHRRPQPASYRDAARLYQPGIGPFGEDAAVAMTVAEMQEADKNAYANAGKRRYPGSSHVCDLALGALPEWAIEVKLARLGRDNGTYEDAAIKKILSPYPDDRSAVTDCVKLARSGFAGKCAILIYGFEDPQRPLAWLIEAFEAVAARTAVLGSRQQAPLRQLVHPVFAAGRSTRGK